jgi:hypothetical protein
MNGNVVVGICQVYLDHPVARADQRTYRPEVLQLEVWRSQLAVELRTVQNGAKLFALPNDEEGRNEWARM